MRLHRWQGVARILRHKAHFERAKGNDKQNRDYCSKGKDYWEHGKPVTGRGHRSDLQKVVDLIKDGETSLQKIAIECPVEFIKFHRGISTYLKTIHPIPSRDFKTEVFYFWGPPGSGKSRRAQIEAGFYGGETYYKPRGDWWDGYKQHDNVIIDDFYGWIKYDELLKITDRYPYRVPVKGGYEEFITKRIWITSNVPLDQLYRFPGYNCEAIKRRCTSILNIF